jgi:hypothetical protein
MKVPQEAARAAQMADCSHIIVYEPDTVYQEGVYEGESEDIPEILLRSSQNYIKKE